MSEIINIKTSGDLSEVKYVKSYSVMVYEGVRNGHNVNVEIFDYGSSAGQIRYEVTATSDNEKTAHGNAAGSVKEALEIVHWHQLDL